MALSMCYFKRQKTPFCEVSICVRGIQEDVLLPSQICICEGRARDMNRSSSGAVRHGFTKLRKRAENKLREKFIGENIFRNTEEK